MRITSLKPSPSMAVGLTALVVAMSGTSYAAVTVIKANSVGAAQIRTSAVTSSEVKDGSLLKKDFKAGQLPAGAQGPAGPAGPAGANGAPGAAGPQGPAGTAVAWANVSGAGAVVSKFGNITVTRAETGVYCVTAPAGKIAMATLGTVGGADSIYVAQGGLAGCPDSANFGVQVGAGSGATVENADNEFAILVS